MRAVALAVLALLAGGAAAQPEPALRLRATPLLAEKVPEGQPPAFVQGDRISGRTDLETVIEFPVTRKV